MVPVCRLPYLVPNPAGHTRVPLPHSETRPSCQRSALALPIPNHPKQSRKQRGVELSKGILQQRETESRVRTDEGGGGGAEGIFFQRPKPMKARTSRQALRLRPARMGRSDLRLGQWLCRCSIVISAAAAVPGSKLSLCLCITFSLSPSAFCKGGREPKGQDVAYDARTNFPGLFLSSTSNS